MRSALGIHLPNCDTDINKWIDVVKNGSYTLLHMQAGWCKAIKEAYPESLILVRCYTPNWNALEPEGWARECASIYNGVKQYTRHITWANEQNLAAESGGTIGADQGRKAQRSDYERIRDWNDRFITAFLSFAPDAILHYPAFASGHSDDQDDYGFVGLDICRAGIERCQVLDRHLYWTLLGNQLDRWTGLERISLTEALFPDKPIFISETGNFAVEDSRSPGQYQKMFYYWQDRPSVLGITPFIADSQDPGHNANNISRNENLVAAIRDTVRYPRYNGDEVNVVVASSPPKEKNLVQIAPGRGLWVWYLDKNGGVQGVLNKLHEAGATWVAIKGADAGSVWPQLTSEVVNQFKQDGFVVYGWQYCYGSDVDGEIAAAKAVLDTGVDGFIADVEAEYEGKVNEALKYSQAVRAYTDKFFGYAPLPVIDMHSSLPYIQFNAVCDAVLPQFYTNTLGSTYPLNKLYDSWNSYKSLWEGSGFRCPPISPIGEMYGTATPASVVDFENHVPAGASWSYWSADDSTPEMRQAAANKAVPPPAQSSFVPHLDNIWAETVSLVGLEHVQHAVNIQGSVESIKELLRSKGENL